MEYMPHIIIGYVVISLIMLPFQAKAAEMFWEAVKNDIKEDS